MSEYNKSTWNTATNVNDLEWGSTIKITGVQAHIERLEAQNLYLSRRVRYLEKHRQGDTLFWFFLGLTIGAGLGVLAFLFRA